MKFMDELSPREGVMQQSDSYYSFHINYVSVSLSGIEHV